jgi:hypothetical protein
VDVGKPHGPTQSLEKCWPNELFCRIVVPMTRLERRTLPVLPAVFVLAAAAASASADEAVDRCFDDLPIGWRVTRSFVVPPDQTAAIAQRLGGSIRRLTNTFLSVQGREVRVNIIDGATDEDAAKLHSAVSRLKGHAAFCVRQDRRVVEFTGRQVSVALATKASYELGLVPRPEKVRYRVMAKIATVDEADYMSFNRLFNLFLQARADPADAETAGQVSALSKRFRFGDQLTLRTSSSSRFGPAIRLDPDPDNQELAAHGETITYTFSQTPRALGVPFVTATIDVTANDAGVTPTARRLDEGLLSPTRFWPADDPEIIALAKSMTSGRRSNESQVEAILEWLAPGRNVKSGGPVSGSRWGVKRVLEQKYGHCWDFADCFVTLCRASGIPCRQVGGWLYGVEGHIWAEVLVEGTHWRQVDPTGGGRVDCGIYHVPYFATEDGEMPIVYVAQPAIDILSTD